MSKDDRLTSLIGRRKAEAQEEGSRDDLRIITLINDEAHFHRQDSVTEGKIRSLMKLVEGVDVPYVDVLFLDRGASQSLFDPRISQIMSPGRRRGEPEKRDEFRARLRGYLQERTETSTDDLADQLVPDVAIPSPLKVLGARREAEIRFDLLREFGAYSSEELGELRSKAENRHALASRWRSKGKVFSVDFHGRQLFPGFQFDAGSAPLSVVAEVLAELPREEMSDWEVALWWVAANEWLGGARPVDLLAEDPAALPIAASHLAEPSAI
ncbi:MAG TPA: hypothetical protein VGH14_21810 [Solirubrobacterales bacterium]|jgi:hypothetical protein